MIKTMGVILLFFALISAPVVSGKIPESRYAQEDCQIRLAMVVNPHAMVVNPHAMAVNPRLDEKCKEQKKQVHSRQESETKKNPRIQRGIVSYYHYSSRHRLASGERYSDKELTAAHKTLPFGTIVRVTRTDTGDSVIVTINDRGPFVRRRIIDLNIAAAKQIGLSGRKGITFCELEVLKTPDEG